MTETEAPQTSVFEVVAKDTGGDPIVMRAGLSPREARTLMVAEAGIMAGQGWAAVGVSRQSITMAHPDDDKRRTVIRIRKQAEA